MEIKENEVWYALEANSVIDSLHSDEVAGLSSAEVQSRLEKYGKNVLPQGKKTNPIIKFFGHFKDVLIYVLFAASIITAYLGQYLDSFVILAVAFINAAIGFMQEHKAEKALDDIKKLLSLKAQVIRDGERQEIESPDLVVGDLVILAPGDKVPADLRIIKSDNLRIEESALTGESLPSEKIIEALDTNTMLGDRTNMAFSSTSVSAGTGLGLVIAVGKDTEIGKINTLISEVEDITTPLIKQTAQFGKIVSLVIICLSVLIYIFGYFYRDYDPADLLLAVIGLTVAAIPEGLPAILSIILAIGVQNMAKRNAIIRHLPSVETLGAVSVICSDKTGTLTKNEMTVKTLEIREGEFLLTGDGYSPEGNILDEEKIVDTACEPVLKTLIDCFSICNESSLHKDEEGEWHVIGDPTEGALISLFEKSKIVRDKHKRLSTIPFDSQYKYMATLVEYDKHNVIYIKGAPDRLLDMALQDKMRDGYSDFDRHYWENKITELATKGQRVIGAAYKIVDKNISTLDHSDVQEGIVFLGLAGIIDPPREEAIEAIRMCAQAGITVKMITGDHIDTARAIGKELGIGDGIKALQGKDLEKMDDAQFEDAAQEYNIFARTSPEHKLKLVTALQKRGFISAMTGDGVNDAPALKKADIGIAMGIKGTEVTKDAAEMVLADDNFSTIVAAVEEGRRVYDNLKKTILFILPTNGAESFLIIASILFQKSMPLTPVQILWVNMVTSITISLALAFEKLEPGAMKRPPRAANLPLLSPYFIWRILFVSVLIGGGTLFLGEHLINKGFSLDIVQTITLQTLVITQMFHLFNSRSIRGFAFNKDFFTNKAVFAVSGILILLQVLITYSPAMNSIFGTVSISASDWIYPITFGFIVFVIVEIEKGIMRQIDAWKMR